MIGRYFGLMSMQCVSEVVDWEFSDVFCFGVTSSSSELSSLSSSVRMMPVWGQPILESLPVFGERVLPSSLSHRRHWRTWLSHLWINSA